MGVLEELVYVDIIPYREAILGECFLNVLRKIEQAKGEAIYGWQFCEYTYMIEAEFHAIWKSPEGNLIDITPSADPTTTKTLFGIDQNKKYDGSRTDNFRLNTTDNSLVDDSIEIEQAKFKFIDIAKNVDGNGNVMMTFNEKQTWHELNRYSFEVDKLFDINGTINSPCFCGSTFSYKTCHRDIMKQFLKTI
ncbi:MAG: hypothetical protein K9G46_11865 [Flavobacteriales bacterium]|nr:hypothetical protein [Flavobacteriales bacterium]